jgi:hypothetical protein
LIYYGEIEYTSGYLGCQDVRERERVTVELRGTVGSYINTQSQKSDDDRSNLYGNRVRYQMTRSDD